MENKFKVGDKVVLAKRQMEKEPGDVQDAVFRSRGVQYDIVYVVTGLYYETDVYLDKLGGRSIYSRFFELAATKTVGFIIED